MAEQEEPTTIQEPEDPAYVPAAEVDAIRAEVAALRAQVREAHEELDRRKRCLTTVDDLRDGETTRLQGKTYPLVGGRLRAFREDWGPAGTIAVDPDPEHTTDDLLVLLCRVYGDGKLLAGARGTSKKRNFQGRETMVEMAETRAIGRALRMAGYGVDGTGLEEMQGPDMTDDEGSEPPSAEQRRTIRDILKEADKNGLKLGDDLTPPETKDDAEDLIKSMREELQKGMSKATNGKAKRGTPSKVK